MWGTSYSNLIFVETTELIRVSIACLAVKGWAKGVVAMPSRTGISKYSAIAVALLASSLTFGAVVFAAEARQFAGTFKILEAKNQGNQVAVHLALRIFNHSGADVKGATISFQSSVGTAENQVAARNVTLRVNEHQSLPALETTLTISAHEYAEWRAGSRPNLAIDFQDAYGKQNHQTIELARMP